MLKTYKESFLNYFGAVQGCSSESATKLNRGVQQDYLLNARQTSFEDGYGHQKYAFDFTRQGEQAEQMQDVLRPAFGCVKLFVTLDPRSAYWCQDGFPASPIEFALACVHELASRVPEPMHLGEEQLDLLSLLACKVEDIVQSKQQDDCGSSGKVAQSMYLLLGPGGAGKTEIVSICRCLFDHMIWLFF